MAWHTIANGDHPDGDKLMENFNYRFQSGTFAALKAIAEADPTVPFVAIATDIKTVFIYSGDTTIGDSGFVAVGGGGW